MAEINPLFMDIDSVYSGDELGLPYRDLISEGVISPTGGGLLVTEKAGTPGLSVDIAAGTCWVKGDTDPARQPTYRCRNDATVNVGISPDPTNPRKVRVVAQVTDEAFAGTGRKWEVIAIHGTPAGSPTLPAEPASAISLASIDVTANDTSITNSQITDLRTACAIGGDVPPVQGVPAGSVTAYGGSSAPAGWLLCDGSAVSQTTYAALYAVVGTTYGNPGGGNFNLPDLRGRMPVGLGTHVDVDALGENDGVAVGSRRPKHAHTHTLGTDNKLTPDGGLGGGSTNTNYVGWGGTTNTTVLQHNHSITGSIGVSGMTDTPAYLVLNYIIKT